MSSKAFSSNKQQHQSTMQSLLELFSSEKPFIGPLNQASTCPSSATTEPIIVQAFESYEVVILWIGYGHLAYYFCTWSWLIFWSFKNVVADVFLFFFYKPQVQAEAQELMVSTTSNKLFEKLKPQT